MFRKIFLTIALFILFLANSSTKSHAQTNEKEEYMRGKVTEIVNQGEIIIDSQSNPFQEVKLHIIDGSEKGKEIVVPYGRDIKIKKEQLLKINETVVLVKVPNNLNTNYYIVDKYRLSTIIPIIIFFFVVVIALSRWHGVGSVLGMIISLLTIVKYIVPQILAGNNPLTTSIIGSLFIMVTTIYLAHGFSSKTTIAVLSTFITLTGIGLLSAFFIKTTSLTGLGSEEASSLLFGMTSNIDFRGLLLGGIIIGALGVLDDITTSLTASVFEIAKVNPKAKFTELWTSGISIGTEHISSLVNTLVLAYAGSSLPIFLMIVLNVNHYPLWAVLNDGLIIEEVVRTLAGSLGLIAAVPLTTFLSAVYLARKN